MLQCLQADGSYGASFYMMQQHSAKQAGHTLTIHFFPRMLVHLMHLTACGVPYLTCTYCVTILRICEGAHKCLHMHSHHKCVGVQTRDEIQSTKEARLRPAQQHTFFCILRSMSGSSDRLSSRYAHRYNRLSCFCVTASNLRSFSVARP